MLRFSETRPPVLAVEKFHYFKCFLNKDNNTHYCVWITVVNHFARTDHVTYQYYLMLKGYDTT